MSATSRCIIIAIFTPKPGQLEAVRTVLTDIIPEVHDEPGCEFYALHEDTDGRLVFVEAWDSRELWVQHTEFHTVTRIKERTDGLLDKPIEVIEAYAVPAGGPAGLIPALKG